MLKGELIVIAYMKAYLSALALPFERELNDQAKKLGIISKTNQKYRNDWSVTEQRELV